MSDMPAPTFSPARQLVLNVLLSALVSAAVFVMIAQVIMVPQLARQQAQIAELQGEVEELQAVVAREEDDAEAPAAAQAAPAPAVPAAAGAK